MTAKIGTAIRLGAPLALREGEWLHSAISRWAWDFGVSRAALLDAFGLADIPPSAITALGTRLLPEHAANISYATGIPEQRLRDSTMETLAGSLVRMLRRVNGQYVSTISKQGPWSWQAGTRYCPDCVRADPGVFKVLWRSPWAFACTTHRRVLLDGCPSCHGAIVEMRGRNTDPFDPSTCRAHVGEKNAIRRTPCRATLEDTWEHFRLERGSAPLVAQEAICSHHQTDTGADLIQVLQSIATALRGSRSIEDIARLSKLDENELRGLVDDEKHVGISAPSNAYAMAALTGAAWALVCQPATAARSVIRQTTFSRPPARVPRGAGHGPGSPAELLTRWPGAPDALRSWILRAHDQDLTVTQRVLWDTAITASTMHAHPPLAANPLKRRSQTPQALWPEWCSRLDVGGNVDNATLMRALAIAVRAVGMGDEARVQEESSLMAVLRANMLGTPEQATAVLAGISELAHTVDDAKQVINYPRRLDMPSAEMLHRTHWEQLAESIHTDPGGAPRLRHARRYLWQRLSATTVDQLPADLRIGFARDDAARYTDFRMRMTAELQGALDRYGQAFLNAHRIWEPVTAAPEVTAHLDWPGSEILDLNIERLHSMLHDGIRTQRVLAQALGVTTRQVTRAIDACPPVTGDPVDAVAWEQLLVPRPPSALSSFFTTQPEPPWSD